MPANPQRHAVRRASFAKGVSEYEGLDWPSFVVQPCFRLAALPAHGGRKGDERAESRRVMQPLHLARRNGRHCFSSPGDGVGVALRISHGDLRPCGDGARLCMDDELRLKLDFRRQSCHASCRKLFPARCFMLPSGVCRCQASKPRHEFRLKAFCSFEVNAYVRLPLPHSVGAIGGRSDQRAVGHTSPVTQWCRRR